MRFLPSRGRSAWRVLPGHKSWQYSIHGLVGGLRPHLGFYCSDPVDLDAHLVTRFEPPRWLHRQADTSRRSSENYVARLQRHRAAQMHDLVVDVEHQVLRVGALPPLAVDETA